MTISKAFLACGCAALVFGIHSAAWAQDVPQGASRNDRGTETEASGTGDIVVTAQRREQRLLDVPISISAVSGENLAAAGVSSTQDLTIVTPGLTATITGYAFQPVIRGIGTQSSNLGDETNVALYIDNVYQPFMNGNAFNLRGLERVEVLKGPQGTLFGRNATGGAIRVFTKDPGDSVEGSLSANYGFRLRSIEIDGIVGGPVSDTLSAIVEAYFYKDDGFIRNVAPTSPGRIGDTEQETVRAKLIWKPSGDFTLRAGANYSRRQSSLAFSTSALPDPAGQVLSFKNVRGVVLVPNPSTSPYYASLSFDPYHTTSSQGAWLSGEVGLGSHTATFTTSYQDYEEDNQLDPDRTNLDLAMNFIGRNGRAFSQEVTLASQWHGPVNYVAGAFYFSSREKGPINLGYAAPLSAVDASGLRTVLGPLAKNSDYSVRTGADSIALFGEVTWQVVGGLSLIGGYRYTDEHKTFSGVNNLTSATTSGEKTFRNSSFRVTAKYDIGPNANIYATYSTGFKSGAYNTAGVVNPPIIVEPEKVKAIEVGIKLREGNVDLSAAGFSYDYTNIQLVTNNILNPSLGSILQNAATATIRGGEIQIGWRPLPGLSFDAGASYIPTARYDSFPSGTTFAPRAGGLGAALTILDLSGTRMIRTPKFTGNAGVNYGFDLGGGKAALSASYFYNSGFYWVPAGVVRQPSYSIVNAKASWTDPSDKWTLSVWGRNLAGEVYYQSTSVSTGGFVGTFAEPRTVGIGVEYKF